MHLFVFDHVPIHIPFVRFFGSTIYALRTVNLCIGWGKPSSLKFYEVTFVVVDCLASYNIILGYVSLNVMKA